MYPVGGVDAIGAALGAAAAQAGARPWGLSFFCGGFYARVRVQFGQQQQQMSFSFQAEGVCEQQRAYFVDQLGPTRRDRTTVPRARHAVRLSLLYPCRLRSRHHLTRWRSPSYTGSTVLVSKGPSPPCRTHEIRGVFFWRAGIF